MVKNMDSTPIYDQMIKEKPISEEEVGVFLLFLHTSENLKCEAQHVVGTPKYTRPMGPCTRVAEYRAICSDHQDETWRYGKNVCAEFVQQVFAHDTAYDWRFVPI